ncbi:MULTISPECIES: DUF4328 domain-containing protein [unclassified Streptomyces]|uniref:DUF4328 domain-containing protein n=1 Tax=unclassified Streptomyces TaxID=2593676 RepID=UPI000DAD6F47|nr:MULTISPECIES: DUF4328 domain-containing protein [unclassified Streptomyces]PZT76243.1 DUF4328 domain-containing protein [Streptomyces sp. AC1-42W]PZT79804.1 DUF4328 domain-containing protein [Streptomyces sp. AC1-42T]
MPSTLRSPVGLGTAVCVLLGAVAVTDVLSIAAGVHSRVLLADGLDDGFLAVDERAWTLADNMYGSAGALQGIALLATGIVFLVWLRRVRRNAEVFDPYAHSLRPGWAIGAWFVPIANLWLPYRVATGVWTASVPADTLARRAAAPRGVLNAWWTALVATQILGRAAGGYYDRAESGDEIIRGLDLVMAANALDIAAAVVAILFVRRLTAMQDLRARAGGFPAQETPPRVQWGRAH